MDLYERHVLDLDAPVQSWVGGESWYKDFPNASKVTLRQLLTHTSGWPSHVDVPAFQRAISQRVNACPTCLFSPVESLKFLRGRPPLFAPGAGWFYSESNYLVAGLIIEKATHRSYYGLLEERILRPLGLSHTVPSNTNRIPGLIAGRIEPKTNYFGIDARSTIGNGLLRYNPGLEWTGGGLAASSGDLARWGALLYSGRALPEPYLQDLFASVPAGPNSRYGLAVDIKRVGGVLYYGHTGSIPGYRSVLRYFPATQLAVAAQVDADLNHDGPIYDSLVSATLEAAKMVGGIKDTQGFRGIDCHS
jgi:D-alanyl-D-alanine carboxypeptidase